MKLLFFFLLFPANFVLAVDVFVAAGGSDSFDGSKSKPFATIQKGIDASGTGDKVWVLPGTYSGVGNKAINLRGKIISVRSTQGPDSTIIDCGGRKLLSLTRVKEARLP